MGRIIDSLATILLLGPSTFTWAAGNALDYLDDPANPYWVNRTTAKLVTPQWIGEEGVDAVIVFAIDDMSDAARYEAFLRPILDRLARIDGRSPLSVMTKTVDPQLPQLQSWNVAGVSVEAHTKDHPCPCLQGGKLEVAKSTFDRCVDELMSIPNHRPVAYRMPCCDSMNSVSPRFFTEIFTRTTPAGNFLTMDSSVMMLFTSDDPDLPRDLILVEGQDRFRRYIPTDRLMINYVEDYPYPYVIDRLCWEFPALMPSDWDAQHLNGTCSPDSVRDFQIALDLAVKKQGVFSICFHPHNWIQASQIVELIDHAVSRHGNRIKFLSFKDVQQRLNANLLDNQPLRTADGADNGVRVCDVNGDGFMDVVIGNASGRRTRIWSPATRQWTSVEFPCSLVDSNSDGKTIDAGVRWGVMPGKGSASVLACNDKVRGLWHFRDGGWVRDPLGLEGLAPEITTQSNGQDRGVRLRDLDGDGTCELMIANSEQNLVYHWTGQRWTKAEWNLPGVCRIVNAEGRDAGLRLIDLNGDQKLDLVFSDAQRWAAYRFRSLREGWSDRMFDEPRRGNPGELPMIMRADGSNNGAWFSFGHMWVQNEDTGKAEPEHVLQRAFDANLMTTK